MQGPTCGGAASRRYAGYFRFVLVVSGRGAELVPTPTPSAARSPRPAARARSSGSTPCCDALFNVTPRFWPCGLGLSRFPGPLRRYPLPKGTTFGCLQCGDVVCARLTGVFNAAARVIGGRLITVKADASTEDVQKAFSSFLAQKPAAASGDVSASRPDRAAATCRLSMAAGPNASGL
jgi:hypothetical protein